MKRLKSKKRGSLSNERLDHLMRIGQEGEPLNKNTVVSAMNKWQDDKVRRPHQSVKK